MPRTRSLLLLPKGTKRPEDLPATVHVPFMDVPAARAKHGAYRRVGQYKAFEYKRMRGTITKDALHSATKVKVGQKRATPAQTPSTPAPKRAKPRAVWRLEQESGQDAYSVPLDAAVANFGVVRVALEFEEAATYVETSVDADLLLLFCAWVRADKRSQAGRTYKVYESGKTMPPVLKAAFTQYYVKEVLEGWQKKPLEVVPYARRLVQDAASLMFEVGMSMGGLLIAHCIQHHSEEEVQEALDKPFAPAPMPWDP